MSEQHLGSGRWDRWRDRKMHGKVARAERKRFYRASVPPGAVRSRTFAVYVAVTTVALLLVAIGFGLLYWRTQQVCGPLRFGEKAGRQAQTVTGKDYARTFGDAADHLGCGGR